MPATSCRVDFPRTLGEACCAWAGCGSNTQGGRPMEKRRIPYWLGIVTVALVASCGTPSPQVKRAGTAGAAGTSLKVGLYPYVPNIAQFQTVIANAWGQVQPNVTLNWASSWDGGYDMDPDSSYDVFVFDAINLSYFQSQGYL